MPNIRGGQEKILITVYPGDGSKMPEDEVRKAANAKKAAPGEVPQNTEEMKKAQAEFEAKKKEVEEKNKKAANVNEITTRSIKEGKEAMDTKNYDVAIAKYTEGFAADPDFVGSAPIFLLNRGVAHVARAIETHNASVKSTDATEKVAAAGRVKQDILDAVQGYQQALTIQKNAAPADIPDKANFDATKMSLLRSAADAFRRSVETERVDPAIIDLAKVMIPEYLAVESDAAKKNAVSLILPDMYRIQGESENAIAGYKQVLETSPDNPDALVGAGLSLVNLGFINDDKAKLQEGANYLQKFVSVAPDTHKLKISAADSIKYLKEQNITPVKAGPAPKKKP
ncbi:MAG: tetratricopeptide repeat protein [Acidobacteria bacterium]|nr:tetratricopeptide repeat protein [Acidobacteriota bacterium]